MKTVFVNAWNMIDAQQRAGMSKTQSPQHGTQVLCGLPYPVSRLMLSLAHNTEAWLECLSPLCLTYPVLHPQPLCVVFLVLCRGCGGRVFQSFFRCLTLTSEEVSLQFSGVKFTQHPTSFYPLVSDINI